MLNKKLFGGKSRSEMLRKVGRYRRIVELQRNCKSSSLKCFQTQKTRLDIT